MRRKDSYKEDPSPSDVQSSISTCNWTEMGLFFSSASTRPQWWKTGCATYPIGQGQSIESHEATALALEEHITNLRYHQNLPGGGSEWRRPYCCTANRESHTGANADKSTRNDLSSISFGVSGADITPDRHQSEKLGIDGQSSSNVGGGGTATGGMTYQISRPAAV